MRIPGLRSLLRALEHRLADGPAAALGGFYIGIYRKRRA
jgi:hypothetical protein